MDLSRTALVLLVMFIAGCASSGEDEMSPSPPIPSEPRILKERFNLRVTEVEATSVVGNGESCVELLTDSQFQLLGGTYIATWEPSAPNHARLHAGIKERAPTGVFNQTEGQSPLTLGLPPMNRSSGDPTIIIFLGAPPPASIVMEQRATADVEVRYSGNLQTRVVPCSFGGE